MNKKWYLITGASSGIGYATAKFFLDKQDCNLVLLSRNGEKVVELLSSYDTNSFYLKADLCMLDEIENIFKIINSKGIILSGLIHCAGLSPLMKIQNINIEDMLETFNVNYFSFIVLMKFFSKPEYSLDHSRVIALSSIVTKTKGRRQAIYASSKAALENSISYLSYELMNRSIIINGIALAVVNTNMFNELCDKSVGLRENTVSKQLLGLLPLEVVSNNIYNMMCSDNSCFTTGTIVEINGGFQY